DVHHRGLKACGEIGALRPGRRRRGAADVLSMASIEHGRLQATEAEFQTAVLAEGPRARVSPRIPRRRLAFDRWSARETEPENGRDFIEGFPGRVIARTTHQG